MTCCTATGILMRLPSTSACALWCDQPTDHGFSRRQVFNSLAHRRFDGLQHSARLRSEGSGLSGIPTSTHTFMSTAKIQDRGQVTIPTAVRRQAGLSKGDLVEFAVKGSKIVITPKVVIDRSQFPNADDEYTPAERRIINRGINQSLKEYRQGKVS